MQQNIFGGPILSANTPLMYPGAKSKLWQPFMKLLPFKRGSLKTIVSPFCGSAALEIRCAVNGIKVVAGDNCEPMINFWQYYQKDSNALVDQALEWFPLSYQEGVVFYYNELAPNCTHLDGHTLSDFERAATFLLINRQSFNGQTLIQSPLKGTPQGNMTVKRLEKLRDWYNPNLTFVHSDYTDLINHYEGQFMYFDPPYVGAEYIYGTKNMDKSFNHKEFRNKIADLKNNWILSYRKHDLIMDLYQDFRIVQHNFLHHQGLKGKQSVVELFIMNY